MLTDEEFKFKWNRLSSYQRKFCLEYIKTFDVKQSAINAGYTGCMAASPMVRIFRKVQPITDYLIQKNNLISAIVKPEWVLSQYRKLYNSAVSEITKQNILKELSKIVQLQTETNNINIENNIPQTPIQIIFEDTEDEDSNQN